MKEHFEGTPSVGSEMSMEEASRYMERVQSELEQQIYADLRLVDRLDSVETLAGEYLEAQRLVKSYQDEYRETMDMTSKTVRQLLMFLKREAEVIIEYIVSKEEQLARVPVGLQSKVDGVREMLAQLTLLASLDVDHEPNIELVSILRSCCDTLRAKGFDLR